jgi:hypothetical protein
MFYFRIDQFRVPALDIGKIVKVKVKHDGSGKSPSWYLNKVNLPPKSFLRFEIIYIVL